MTKSMLSNYLGKCDLTESLVLTNHLSFHWANWDETCLIQRKIFKNYNQNHHLSKLNNRLMQLKSKPVWLCNKVKVLKSDLYSLYESYLDSRLRMTWFERKDEILFSFDGEQGPYQTLTTMKWLDKEVYAQFVMRKILLDFFTLRSFRLNTDLPIVLKFDNDVNFYHDKVILHQISEDGAILKFTDKNFFNKIKNSSKMELKIPIQTFIDVSKKPFLDSISIMSNKLITTNDQFYSFVLESKIINIYGNAVNSKRSGEEEFYLFAKYEDFLPVHHKNELDEVFRPLVKKTKYVFDQELRHLEAAKEEKKSA